MLRMHRLDVNCSKNNYANGLHKVREELNQLSFQVKAQAQLERSTTVKQIMSNLPNDTGAL